LHKATHWLLHISRVCVSPTLASVCPPLMRLCVPHSCVCVSPIHASVSSTHASVCPPLMRLCVPHSCVCVSPTHASNIRSIKHLQLCVCVHGCKPSPGHLSLARVRDPLNFAPPSLHNSIFLTINHRKTQCSADVKMLTCTSLACICAKRAPHSCCSICTLPSNDCDFDWASAWSVPACACASCS